MRRWLAVFEFLGSIVCFALGVSLIFFSSRDFFRPKPITALEQRNNLEDGNHVNGSKDARVTVVGFFDLAAPESVKGWNLLKQLQDFYGDSLRMEFRHYPVTALRARALPAAVALEAADKQGKFWEYLSMLFDQQNSWVVANGIDDLFSGYAKTVGIVNVKDFMTAYRGGQNFANILRDLRLGQSVGVEYEPTFFVNGVKADTEGLKLSVEKILSKPS